MELIREAREKKGLTQKELADLLGISVRTIQAIEQGQRKPGQILTIKLFKVLKIPISKLEFFLQQYTTNWNAIKLIYYIGDMRKEDSMESKVSKIELIETENKAEIKIDGMLIKGIKNYEIKRNTDIVELTLTISAPVENFTTN